MFPMMNDVSSIALCDTIEGDFLFFQSLFNSSVIYKAFKDATVLRLIAATGVRC